MTDARFEAGHGTSRLFTNVFMAFREHIPFPGEISESPLSAVCTDLLAEEFSALSLDSTMNLNFRSEDFPTWV